MSPDVQIPGKTQVVNEGTVIAATEVADLDLASTSCIATLPPSVNLNCLNCELLTTSVSRLKPPPQHTVYFLPK